MAEGLFKLGALTLAVALTWWFTSAETALAQAVGLGAGRLLATPEPNVATRVGGPVQGRQAPTSERHLPNWVLRLITAADRAKDVSDPSRACPMGDHLRYPA
ncbi:hypothetical protein GCM10009730_50890 [Streptomyces albidochromogenes]|uniref:hypothetical protein n=1 Tax=Streptomyces albidochromogenes TaxID=329524 RepID=UPI00110F91D1|nr:hypothetical protein [Streptomyces albidochromogenes]